MQPFAALTYNGQIRRLRHLADAALAHYALPTWRLVPLVHMANTTFRVATADGGRYVLRITPPEGKAPEIIGSELLWLSALCRDTNLRVPEPVPTRDGALLTIAQAHGVPEPRTCALFRWLPGRFLEDRLTPAHLTLIGTFTAQLHEHTAHWQPAMPFVRGRVDTATATARSTAYLDRAGAASAVPTQLIDDDATRSIALTDLLCSTQDAALVETVIGRVRAMFAQLGYGDEMFGIIHADLHQENYLFHRGQPCAIDFDDCGWGHYLFDLNVTLRELRHLPHYPDLRLALLRGYRRVRSLPQEHEAYLATFFALRNIQMLVWFLEFREHPAFRDHWQESAQDELQQLRRFVERT